MADVFISYKSERRNAALHLKQIFELNGYTVWFDYGLLTGRDFARQIEKELTAAKAVVVLWCSRSVQSKWVIDEAFFAQENGKYIPVWIEKIPLPFGFQRDDTINLADWDAAPRSPDLDRLFDQIAYLTDRAPAPNYHGLRQHEANWKMFGAPRLADFALDKDLEAERACREEEERRFAEIERQRKDEEDARREAEEQVRVQREAEQQRKENEELEHRATAKLQAEAEKRAKQALHLAKKRETELKARKSEKFLLKPHAESERAIKQEEKNLISIQNIAHDLENASYDEASNNKKYYKIIYITIVFIGIILISIYYYIYSYDLLFFARCNSDRPHDLAINYEYGLNGYNINPQMAFECYKIAADNGNRNGAYKTATFYDFGLHGQKQNSLLAQKYYKISSGK